MNDIANLLTVVFGLAVLVVGGLLGLQQGSIRTLRSSNGDLRNRVLDLENTVATVVGQRDTAVADREALARVVTGEAHWVSLGLTLDEHHTQALIHWGKDEELLSQILTAVQEAAS